MPYYQNPTWGDMIAQAGDALQRYLMQREEAEMTRIKNTYGNNLEAWRQASIKDPESRQAKLYKKFVGDPNIALPEDPQVAAARMQQENLARWIDETQDPQLKQALRGLLYGAPAGVVEKSIAMMPQPPKQADVVARKDKLQELYPNSTPLQRAEMARSDVTGNNPWMTTTTPGRVNPDLPYSAMSPTVYDYKMEQVSPDVYESTMGQTKQQIKLDDLAQRRKMAQDKFDNLKENQQRIDERFQKTFNRIQAQWKEGQKYKMTPEQRIQFNATVSALNRRAANLYKQKNTAANDVKKLESEVSSLKAGKAMMGDVGGEYAKAIDQQITDTTNRLDAAKKAQDDIETQIVAMESEIPTYGSVTAAPDAGGGTGGGNTGKNDFLKIQGK